MMSKVRIALIVLGFVLLTFCFPLVLLLAFVDANAISVYIVVYGIMFFGSIGFLIAMLLKTKQDISDQIEELKVQNAAIAYRLTEMKKQGKIPEVSEKDKKDEKSKEKKKEKFDDFQ